MDIANSRALAAAFRTLYRELPRILPDEAVRIAVERVVREAERSLPEPIYLLWPEGAGWRVGHALSAAVHVPSRGLKGLEVFRAAVLHQSHALEKGSPRGRRLALNRAADWVEHRVGCPELGLAMRNCVCSTSGLVLYVKRGHIRIDCADASRAFGVPSRSSSADLPDDARHSSEVEMP